MNIGILVFDNGLGHLRRQVILANYLVKEGYSIDIYCNQRNANKLKISKKIKTINITVTKKKLGDTTFLKKECAKINFEKYKIFISDNCLEVLDYEPKAVIFGSFFWHRAVMINPEYYEKCEAILNKYKPNILASKIFAPDYIKSQQNSKLIGLFTDFRLNSHNQKKKNGILISIGLGDSKKIDFRLMSEKISQIALHHDSTVWVEPALINEFKGPCFKPAVYTEKMYEDIKVAIIRPGLGTISDLLACNSFIIPIYEKENREMVDNAIALEKLGHCNCKIEEVPFFLETAMRSKLNQLIGNQVSFSGCEDTKKFIEDLT